MYSCRPYRDSSLFMIEEQHHNFGQVMYPPFAPAPHHSMEVPRVASSSPSAAMAPSYEYHHYGIMEDMPPLSKEEIRYVRCILAARSRHRKHAANLALLASSDHPMRRAHKEPPRLFTMPRVVPPHHEGEDKLPQSRSINLHKNGDETTVRKPNTYETLSSSPRNIKDWDVMFEHLKAYKEEFGTCAVPNFYPSNPKLGTWVKNQRGRRYALSEYRQTKLDSIRFFDKPARKDSNKPSRCILHAWEKHWNEMYERLVAYKKKYGHVNVPSHCKEDPQLGYWVKTQRLKKKGKLLSEQRLKKLTEVDFKWKNCDTKNHNKNWSEMFSRLSTFAAEHGHCLVPVRYEGSNKLSNWVRNQRHLFSRLPEDRRHRLKSIGFM